MTQRLNPLDYHAGIRPGKIEVAATKPLTTQRDLSLAYTPGVAEVCRAIHRDPEAAYQYTAKGNLVAVITNGTAVLGLGDIGPMAGKPVMEGKANLFKKFADIDVFDIELDARSVEEIVAAVKAIAPTFGGINLEDIKAPECFEVERRLQELLTIPVFHDDQHGTAIISAAALLNAAELTGRKLSEMQVVFSGAGAAAISCAELYVKLGVSRSNIVMFDIDGLVHDQRTDLFPAKRALATSRRYAGIGAALHGADAFIGLSVGGVVTAEMLRGMAARPIIFAMANPDPEIPYEVARAARPDAILATGRSDYPNQVNNVLGFPFVFRGALDCRASRITVEMLVAATHALAELARSDVPDKVLMAYGLSKLTFGDDYIIPKPFDPRVLTRVAPAVAEAAHASGVARAPIEDLEAYRERLHLLVERARGIMQPLIERARTRSPKRRIVFADGTNAQVQRAAQILVDEGVCTPVLLGEPSRIQANAESSHIKLDGMEIEPVINGEHAQELARSLWQLRARKGMTLAAARSALRQHAWYAAMMVRAGLADGMVGGINRPYKLTIGPALQALGLREGSRLVSGAYAMLFKDRKIFLGDCTVNLEPNAEDLAEIAINTARVAETFGEKPHVALLSYSDFGEHYKDARVRVVRDAISIVRQRWPELDVDGEMQADTALDRNKVETNFPFCLLSQSANVLVFPDLTSGNIAYKLLVKLTDCEALGPLVLGIGGAVGVIPVGATVNEIVNIATYAAVQAPTEPAPQPASRYPETLFTDLRPSRSARIED
ncbi:MAG TPA: NADP-dependent malic enzyme [Polyangiaceae bacterium]|nr:NADP-dependent malic enzyme [Polyangiaceae bacterium]